MGEAVAELECFSCGRTNRRHARFCEGCGARLGAAERAEEHEGAADPLLGRIIADRYRIETLLGRGGMGVVYRVEHVRIGKLMAMKLLHGALARDRDLVKRFQREAEAVSKLDHPNTVQVFDFGQSEGMMYLVMEYLSGRDLGEVLMDEGALPFERVARIAAQACGSVAQAHERGIVHRDLKPENLMILDGRGESNETDGPNEIVKVLDFGLAKLRDAEEAGEKSLTRAGAIVGTPYYMAPEHIRGEAVDARSDVYAMGALIYKAVTGVPPFWAPSPVGVLTQHLTEAVVPPSSRAAVPPEADRIVLKAMAKSPSERFQSMDALRDELLTYLASVGHDGGIASGLVRASALARGSERQVATRGDVDQYERRLRRRNQMGYGLVALAVLGLAVGGAWAWDRRPTPSPVAESEPNDTFAEADFLPEGVRFEAFLGKRLDEERSDADFYRIHNPGGARRVVRIEVTAIPNMDLVVEVFRDGITSPLLTADSGGMGWPEVVPNFAIEGEVYFLRVRELWESGRFPTENVSDPYTVRWSFVTPEEGDELEVNDSLELADGIAPGETRRGYVGWGGDADSYCVEEATDGVVAHLEGVRTLDLVLEVVDRSRGRVSVVNANGVGDGEVSEAVAGEAGSLCFVVSARRPKEGLGNDPDERYALRLEPVAPVEAAE